MHVSKKKYEPRVFKIKNSKFIENTHNNMNCIVIIIVKAEYISSMHVNAMQPVGCPKLKHIPVTQERK